MIAFKFENNTKVSLPTSWREVTVGMFSNPHFLSGNSLELLSSVSNIPVAKLANTTEDLSRHFLKTSKFIIEDRDGWKGTNEVPDMVHLLDTDCKIPKDLNLERFGQSIMLGQAMAGKEFVHESIPDAVAIYLAPQIYGDAWHEKIDKVVRAIKAMPITSVWPIADFFLDSIKKSTKGGKTPSTG